MIIILTSLIAFLFGSIPTGYLITRKMSDIDIRTKGSGNIGSTNVKRVLGNKAAILTQAIDIAKGIIPIILGIWLSKIIDIPLSLNSFLSITAIAVILGHDFTPFLAFKGGKGVNTTIGAFILIAPIPTLIGIAVHFLLKRSTDIVSVRSIVFGLTIPIMCAILGISMQVVVSAAIAALLIILRHKDNLKRMIKKEEK